MARKQYSDSSRNCMGRDSSAAAVGHSPLTGPEASRHLGPEPAGTVQGFIGKGAQQPDPCTRGGKSWQLPSSQHDPHVSTRGHQTLAFICLLTLLMSYWIALDLFTFQILSSPSSATISLSTNAVFLLKRPYYFLVVFCAWTTLTHRRRHFWRRLISNCGLFLSGCVHLQVSKDHPETVQLRKVCFPSMITWFYWLFLCLLITHFLWHWQIGLPISCRSMAPSWIWIHDAGYSTPPGKSSTERK